MTNNNNQNKPSVVLSCIDGSTFSSAVCDYSVWVAKLIAAPLKFLHTVEHPKDPAVSDLSGAIGLGASEELLNELATVEQNRNQLLLKKGNLMLKAVKERALAEGIETVEVRQRHGTLTEALVDLEEQIRILVVGVRGEDHQQEDKGIGTQLESIIRSLHKPILVVNQEFSKPEKIMLAYDGSEAAKKALTLVASTPLFIDTPCHLVFVGEEDKAEQILIDAKQKLVAVGIDVITAVLHGDIEDALTHYQKEHDIDLTLMGAFSHNRFRDFLLGSFTAKMLARTQKPLLLLR